MNLEEYAQSANKTDRVTVRLVEELKPLERNAVIISEGEEREFTYTNEAGHEETVKKPVIMVSIQSKEYNWTLNATTVQKLGEGFESFHTKNWVGGVVRLEVSQFGSQKYVTAFVLEKPPTGSSQE